jgi:uncharacterized membrane protein
MADVPDFESWDRRAITRAAVQCPHGHDLRRKCNACGVEDDQQMSDKITKHVCIGEMRDASTWIGWAGHQHWVKHEDYADLTARLAESEKLSAEYVARTDRGLDALSAKNDELRAEVARLTVVVKTGKDFRDMRYGANQILERNLDVAEAEVARLKAQLPEGMEHCTILFKECRKGHGWLTATNWIQHPCPTCEREAAEAEVARLKAWKSAMMHGACEGYMLMGDDGIPKYKPACVANKQAREAAEAALMSKTLDKVDVCIQLETAEARLTALREAVEVLAASVVTMWDKADIRDALRAALAKSVEP